MSHDVPSENIGSIHIQNTVNVQNSTLIVHPNKQYNKWIEKDTINGSGSTITVQIYVHSMYLYATINVH